MKLTDKLILDNEYMLVKEEDILATVKKEITNV